jgi:hypothetical protein
MLEAFSRPRIEGVFSGDRMRAWNVIWGKGRADVVIQNSYADVQERGDHCRASEITRKALFSLGYPRKDGGEQINARVRLTRRPMADLKRAFELDDYDMDGVVSGDYHVYGDYETPLGFGRLLVEEGVAYGETFESMSSALRFEGTGVRLDSIQIAKATGEVTGAACRRLGRHLLLQRRRPAHPGRVAEGCGVSQRAAVRPVAVQRDRRRQLRRAPLRREGARRRSVRRRGRRRSAHGPAVAARRAADRRL